jgi:hypothetical protein
MLAVSASLLCSIGYFCMSGYLIYAIVERNMILFGMAVLFFVETISFGKYFIEMAMQRRDKAKWHAMRTWVPLADLVVICIAVFTASLILPCGTVANLWVLMAQLDSAAFWLVAGSMVILVIKIVTAATLTFVHVNRVVTLLPATTRVLDHFNFPFTRQVIPPTAPPEDGPNG